MPQDKAKAFEAESNYMPNTYVDQLMKDTAAAEIYYLRSLETKTQQQLLLEDLVSKLPRAPKSVADIACGSGSASHHLSQLLPDAHFELVDLNPNAIDLARRAMEGRRFEARIGDIYALPLEPEAVDLAICWQTLSWIDAPAAAVSELVRIIRPGGTVLASSLFNIDADVDIHARMVDRTRQATYDYHTYSLASVTEWLAESKCRFDVIPFTIGIDLPRTGRGLGTYTETLANGRRLEISAGLLMNWGVLRIVKPE